MNNKQRWNGFIISIVLLLVNEVISQNNDRKGRQLDFDSDIGEKTAEKQVFGQRIKTTTEGKITNQEKLLKSTFKSTSNNEKILDRSYLAPQSAKPPQVKNIVDLNPPFNLNESPSSQNENILSGMSNQNRYSKLQSNTPYPSISQTTNKPSIRTTTTNLFDIISCKSGSPDNNCKNEVNSPLQQFNPFKTNGNIKYNSRPSFGYRKEDNVDNHYLPPFTNKPPETAPTNFNNQYLPPQKNKSPVPAQTNLNNQYLPPTISKPVVQDSTNLNNQYLPPIKPTEKDQNIEPAAAIQNPTVIKPVTEKQENYSLERLCNDPFHSFLCTGATKQRERITGRLRPQAKIPPGVLNGLNGQASFQDTRRVLPDKPKVLKNKETPAIQFRSTTQRPLLQRTILKIPDKDIYPQPAANQNYYLPPISQPTANQRAYLPPPNDNLEKKKTDIFSAQAVTQKTYLTPSIPEQRNPDSTDISPQPAFDQKSYLPPPVKSNANVQPQPSFNENIYLPPFESENSDKLSSTIRILSSTPTVPTFSRTTPFTQTTNKNTRMFYFTQKPVKNVFISPEPSQNFNRVNVPNNLRLKPIDGYTYSKPLQSFPQPTSAATLGLDSSNINENKILPKFQAPSKPSARQEQDKIQPAGAQNSESIAQLALPKGKDREHTLEELCNHPFHSFLCQTPKQRQRFNGRLRTKARIPAGVIAPEGSSIEETKRLPEPTNTDEQRIKPGGYIYPQPSEVNQFLLPTSKKPAPIPFPTTKAPNDDSYYYPQPSEDKAFTLPSRKPYVSSSTTVNPVNSFPKNNGYIYPQPSENKQFALPTTKNPVITSKDSGYLYPQPSEDKQFILPSKNPTTVTSLKDDGYIYPQPSEDKQFRLPSTSNPITIKPQKDNGYEYPQPSEDKQFVLPTTRKPVIYSTVKDNGYIYPQPSEQKQLKLPTTPRKQTPVTKSYSYSFSQTTTTKKYAPEYAPQSSENINQNFSPSNGYNYKKPAKPFTFPTSSPRPISTTAIINYPQPSNNKEEIVSPTDSNGYAYPKPTLQLRLPNFGRRDEESPSPSNNDQSILILKNLKTNKLTTTTTRRTPTPVNKIPKEIENVEPAAAQNPVALAQLVKPKDVHTLEEQCSHAFHSFLCNKPARRRPRPNGRLYGDASTLGSKFLSGASSNTQISEIKPKNTNKQTLSPEPSANQEQVLPLNGYNYRKPSNVFTFPTTVRTTTPNLINAPSFNSQQKVNQPFETSYSYTKPSTTFDTYTTSTTEYPTTTESLNSENPLNFGESKESSINNGYSYNRPENPFNFPTKFQPDFTKNSAYTTLAPATNTENIFNSGIDIRSQNSDQNPTIYPQPSGNRNVQIASSSSDNEKGYFYNKPSNQLRLPFDNYETQKTFQNINLPTTYSTSETYFETSSTTAIPYTSDKIDLSGLKEVNEDQFPFSFFKKATKKTKSQEPLPPESELIILKL